MKPIKHLVFSGGGIRGIAFLGVLQYLEENDLLDQIETYVGTSVGAFILALVNLGYTSQDLYKLILQIDFGRFQNIEVGKFFEKFGIDSGMGIVNLIKLLIKRKIDIDTSTDNLSHPEEITLEQLHELTGKHLVITGTCLNDHRCEYFDYRTAPNLKLYDALRISISIPLMFTAPLWRGKYYADGWVTDDFPLHLYKKDAVGVKLHSERAPLSGSNVPIEGIGDYLSNLFWCFWSKIEQHDLQHLERPHDVVLIEANDVSPIDFSIPMEQKQQLYKTGYSQIKLYFQK